MREIKFRIFDRKTKEMLNVTKFVWGLHEIEEFEAESCAGGGWKNIHRGNFSERFERKLMRYELIQYTGVGDKDGVEIYENTFVNMGNVYLVKWSNKYCGFRLFSRDGSSTGLNPYHTKDYKAIGNAYEDPELLELLEGESDEEKET